MRIRKDPEVRKTEILAAAYHLFCEQGYGQTTVAEIVLRAGVAKGTFFYYFPAKEAVLQEIVSRWAAELYHKLKQEFSGQDAIARLKGFVYHVGATYQQTPIFDRLWEEEQVKLLENLWNQSTKDYFNPLLTEIFEQGTAEGSMEVRDAGVAADFFWPILDTLTACYDAEAAEESLARHYGTAERLLEHLLGIEAGAIALELPQPRKRQ